jgi:hypothetical protein
MKRTEMLSKIRFNNKQTKLHQFYLLKFRLLFTLGLVVYLFSTCTHKYNIQLENGDILFVSADSGTLSSAIDRVTQTNASTHYSHVGLLEKVNNEYWVLHAGTRNGSERIKLDTFLYYVHKDSNYVDVFRLKDNYKNSISNAIEVAKSWLGKPYNYSYILSDKKMYCSDFVQRSFRKASIFKLEPMTFINPKTGKTDASWIEFYEEQGVAIPEGKLGCNPNNMAISGKIRRVGTIVN